jgi:hypothetical protein
VSLRIDGDAAQVARQALLDLPRIAAVDSLEAGWLFVRPRDGASIIGDVSTLLRERAIAVDEIHVTRGHLDEVFRDITTGA